MKIYKLYYADYDGIQDYWFTHPHKLLAEFQQDCVEILDKYKEKVFTAQEGFDYICFLGVPELVAVIADHLPERGYSHLKYECFGFGGSGIISDRDTPENTEILKYIPQDFINRLICHNKNIA